MFFGCIFQDDSHKRELKMKANQTRNSSGPVSPVINCTIGGFMHYIKEDSLSNPLTWKYIDIYKLEFKHEVEIQGLDISALQERKR